MRQRPPFRAGWLRLVALGVVAATTSGCLTGPRPTLIERPVLDDAGAETVVDRLRIASTLDFRATYDITPTLTGEVTRASIEQIGNDRDITIGDIHYVTDGTVSRTCYADDTGCVDFLDDARISNLNLTHRFWGDAFAARLELDASRRIGFSTSTNATIAGLPAACVDIPVPSTTEASGTVQYCALDAGVLGRYVGADVVIELTSFTPGAELRPERSLDD